MPVVSSATPQIVQLAELLVGQLAQSSNGAASASIGDQAVAFDWTGGLRPGPWTVFNAVLTEGLSYRASVVTPSGTPVAKVAPRAPKPQAGSIDSANNTLDTYGGYVDVTTQELVDVSQVVVAIQTMLADQALEAFDADIAVALADAALTASGATWADAILAGVAQRPSADVAVVSPADLAAILSPASGYQVGMKDSVSQIFGLWLIPLPRLATGTAYVCQSNAMTLFTPKARSIVVNAVAAADGLTNVTNIVLDFFAAAQLTSPGAAVAVTKTP